MPWTLPDSGPGNREGSSRKYWRVLGSGEKVPLTHRRRAWDGQNQVISIRQIFPSSKTFCRFWSLGHEVPKLGVMPKDLLFQPPLPFHCSRTGSSSFSHMLTPLFPHCPSKQPMLSLPSSTASHFSSAHLISTHCFCNLALAHLSSCLFLQDNASRREEKKPGIAEYQGMLYLLSQFVLIHALR